MPKITANNCEMYYQLATSLLRGGSPRPSRSSLGLLAESERLMLRLNADK
jgi:hypothetical protein